MSKKNNYTIEKLILIELSRYGISEKLKAIICFIKKIADKYNMTQISIKQLKDIDSSMYLEKIICNLIEQEQDLKRYSYDGMVDFEGKIIRELRLHMIKIGVENLANLIRTILSVDIDSESLKSIYSEINNNKQTSKNLQRIISKLTQDWIFDSLLDMFVGRADLVRAINRKDKNVKLIGNDISDEEIFYAIMNLYINEENNWRLNCVNSITDWYTEEKADLVVSEIPLLERVNINEINKNSFPYGVSNVYIDYLAIQRIIQVLSFAGKAIIIVPNSTLFRIGIDRYIRERIIRDDLVEAVITLPERMYDYTMAQVNILILSKFKNRNRKNKIQFIDASDSYIKYDGKYIMEEYHIDNIVKLYKNEVDDKDKSIFLENEELHKYDYSLFIWNKYRNKILEANTEGKKKIKDVAEVIRGIQISKEKYEQAKKNGATHYYITAGDIDNESGEINVKEESLLKPEERWIEKCQLQENDLIVTMKGSSFKIGIVNNLPNSIISGNLIIIRSNGRYDPYVLKEYLESPQGSMIIKSIQRGTSISIVNPEDLSEVVIPDLTLEEQSKIRENIIKSKKEYIELLEKINKKREEEKKNIYSQMKLGGEISGTVR